ncbi:MAG: papain-like cysteine protease family protein [Clostridia bacterium]|nr:papain-like cysteine protease family protein [Clostridia bacterium]
MSEGEVLSNYLQIQNLIYNSLKKPGSGYIQKNWDEFNNNAIGVWFSVFFGEESMNGCMYAPTNYELRYSPSSGAKYDNVCWACCEVYVQNINNSNITNKEYNKQVNEMVERVQKFNGYYVNSLPGSTKSSPSFNTIVKMLDESGGPIYGSIVEKENSFGNSLQNHAIVIVGAYTYKNKNTIVYYDPNLGHMSERYDDNEMKLQGKKLASVSKVDKDNFD